MELATHQNLANGHWQNFSLFEQLGNIGSEVGRTLKYREATQQERQDRAADRALELFDLTIADPRWRLRLKEILRAREVFCDYIFGDNEYNSTAPALENYFTQFALAARAHK